MEAKPFPGQKMENDDMLAITRFAEMVVSRWVVRLLFLSSYTNTPRVSPSPNLARPRRSHRHSFSWSDSYRHLGNSTPR